MSAVQSTRIADTLGGLSAMLVALPSAVAFGLMVHAPLGGAAAAQGAVVGMVGAVVLGVVAPLVGGTARLVTAPCAPAAAVLAALTTQLVTRDVPLSVDKVLALLGLMGVVAGAVQLLLGMAGGGRIIKYIPYPVVAGYLAGVGLTILSTQLPRALGVPAGAGLVRGLLDPGSWAVTAMLVGAVALGVMLVVARWLPRVPAPLVALVAGVVVDQGMRRMVGGMPPLPATSDAPVWTPMVERWSAVAVLGWNDMELVVVPALTLAALLSLDTLKTCVVLDALTGGRHDSDRELRGQGVANLATAALGGMPGAGTMGATLVNLHGGGTTRWSSLLEGVFSLAALLVLRPVIGALPGAALAGIMVVVGARMVDKDIVLLARNPTTRVDFGVVAVVAATAVGVGLVAAAGAGLALCILLFVREQAGRSVVRRVGMGPALRSKRRRLRADMDVLEAHAEERVVVELQGNLFFGTTDQVTQELARVLDRCRWLVLDLRRVQSLDFSGAHLLEQLEGRLARQGGTLVLAELPRTLPTGADAARYLSEVGVGRGHDNVRMVATLDAALEWTEDRQLEFHGRTSHGRELALAAHEIEVFRELPPEVLVGLMRVMDEHTVGAEEVIFRRGDRGDTLFFIRRGTVRIEVALENGQRLHLATFGQGDFFGDMAFIDAQERSADAVAQEATELFVLSRARLADVAGGDPRLGHALFESLSRTLAHRLRTMDRELAALQTT